MSLIECKIWMCCGKMAFRFDLKQHCWKLMPGCSVTATLLPMTARNCMTADTLPFVPVTSTRCLEAPFYLHRIIETQFFTSKSWLRCVARTSATSPHLRFLTETGSPSSFRLESKSTNSRSLTSPVSFPFFCIPLRRYTHCMNIEPSKKAGQCQAFQRHPIPQGSSPGLGAAGTKSVKETNSSHSQV